MDYARVSRRSLCRRNETVGTNYAGDTASAKGDGRDALRAGMANYIFPALYPLRPA